MDINTTDKPYHKEQLVLLLGSNMGDRLLHLTQSRVLLEQHFGEATKASRVYHTEPWGKTDQESFFNQALIFEVSLRPMMVLDTVLDIEKEIGRVRQEKWGPRIIDIDVIFFGDLVFAGDELRIPHPHMQERGFVLQPLCEIIPEFEHPLLNKRLKVLLQELEEVHGS